MSNKGDLSGLSTVELTVFLAVAYLNDGAGSIVLVLQGLGIAQESTARRHATNFTTTGYATLVKRTLNTLRKETLETGQKATLTLWRLLKGHIMHLEPFGVTHMFFRF